MTILLEELLALGVSGAEYDAWLIRIGEGDQFSSGFVEVNPNSKIPALSDHSTTPPTRVFESGSILLYLAEKFGFFLPKDPAGRTETLNWLFWLQGAAPFLGGGFGHFFNYAPVKIEYAIDRFTMEAKRQLDVLDKQLARNRYVSGEEYTIADMAIWPWYGNVVLGGVYNAAEFLDAGSYKNVLRWAQDIANRPAVKRGRIVNRTNGPLNEQLHERHSASDFDTQPVSRHKVTHGGTGMPFPEEIHDHVSVKAIAAGEDPGLPGAKLTIAGFFKHTLRITEDKPTFIIRAKTGCVAGAFSLRSLQSRH